MEKIRLGMVVAGDAVFIAPDLAVQFVGQAVDRGIHVCCAFGREQRAPTGLYRGFSLLAEFFDIQNNIDMNSVISVIYMY